jgi:hypothetical protein
VQAADHVCACCRQRRRRVLLGAQRGFEAPQCRSGRPRSVQLRTAALARLAAIGNAIIATSALSAPTPTPLVGNSAPRNRSRRAATE